MFNHRHIPRRFAHRRPEWWPENEHWPPDAPRWKGSRHHLFRRLGCLFVLLNLLVAALFLLFFGWLAQSIGLIQPPSSLTRWFPWLFLFGFLLFVAGFIFLVWAGLSLRRLSAPLGDLLEASERLAQGDYSVRLAAVGPPEIRSLVQALNSMADRLQADDAQRRTLLADITHELRTPLTVIQGNLEGMLDGIYPADAAHLGSLLDETRLLTRLVDDLRTLALAESGALRLNKEPTDLAVLIHDTVATFRPQADAAQLSLIVEVAGDPPLISLDPERMRQVLQNLIANALRYTPPGGSITIRYAVQFASEDPPTAVTLLSEQATHILLTVQDSGLGIPESDLPHIFDRFYKTRDSTGMGLGLPIARQLVEAHGGVITAFSSPAQGARFEISLPLLPI
jgi:signal transduction histidine kinase